MADLEDLDRRLARLARATEPLHASPGFTDRVVAATAAPSPVIPSVLRFGRAALLAAAVAAVAGAWAGLDADRGADAALATTYGMEEAAW